MFNNLFKKDETYLDIAERDLKAAKIMYKYKTDDESLINIGAYHLQQAIEHALKHRLEMQGIECPKTHDIEHLLNLQKSDFLPELFPWSGSITLLGSQQDIKNYRASVRTVDAVMELAEKTIKIIRDEEKDLDFKKQIKKIPQDRLEQYFNAGINEDILRHCFEVGWEAEDISKGYIVCDNDGEYEIPYALQVIPIDALGFYNDLEAREQAVKDGIKFINDIEGLEKGIYVDTQDNRKICETAIKNHPEYRIENIFPVFSDFYKNYYSQKYGKPQNVKKCNSNKINIQQYR